MAKHSTHGNRGFTLLLVSGFLGVFSAVFFWEGAPTSAASPHPAKISAETDSITAKFGICGEGPRSTCVVDGDTIWLFGTKIRIADINTPETTNAGCAVEAEMGRKATLRLARLLNEAPFHLSATDRDEDRYGRKLRVVERGGVSLGDQLIREGLAEPWTGRRRNWC